MHVTSCPCHLGGHWGIENLLRHVRDRTFRENDSKIRTGHLSRTMASLRNLAICTFRPNGGTNIAASDGGHTRIPE
ncbi:hypothetical protein [Streptomyces sp. NPDC002399]